MFASGKTGREYLELLIFITGIDIAKSNVPVWSHNIPLLSPLAKDVSDVLGVT